MTWVRQKDKQMHFAGGFLAAFFIALFLGWEWGFVGSTAMGFAKEEFIDRPDPEHHTEEARDAFATSLGGFVGAWCGEWLRPFVLTII